MKNASKGREKVGKEIKAILSRLDSIEKQQNKVIRDLHEYLDERADGAMRELSKYISSGEVKERFTKWTLDEVPKAESPWEVTENQITKVLSNRIHEFIQQWEEDNRVFANAREALVRHFQEQYNLVEDQLRNLQGAVKPDNLDVQTICDPEASLTMTEMVTIAVTSPIWFPIGLAVLVLGAPFVGIMAVKDKVQDKMRLKKYEEDKCAFMAKKSANYLDVVKTGLALKTFVKDQMKEANLCLKQIEARIPELIQADKKLYQQLIDETKSQKQMHDLYQPVMVEASDIRGRLALFGIREVGVMDISDEELDWRDDGSLLGCGMSGVVYQGTMTRHGVDQPVALKVCNEVLDAKNASRLMAEVELLR